MKYNDTIKILKEIKLKATPQRIAIIEFLKENRTHPTPRQIYDLLKKEYPSISLATIYNTLSALKDEGIIEELYLEKDISHIECNTTPHDHFFCLSCKKIFDIMEDKYKDDIPHTIKDFKIISIRKEYFGYCDECVSKEGEN